MKRSLDSPTSSSETSSSYNQISGFTISTSEVNRVINEVPAISNDGLASSSETPSQSDECRIPSNEAVSTSKEVPANEAQSSSDSSSAVVNQIPTSSTEDSHIAMEIETASRDSIESNNFTSASDGIITTNNEAAAPSTSDSNNDDTSAIPTTSEGSSLSLNNDASILPSTSDVSSLLAATSGTSDGPIEHSTGNVSTTLSSDSNSASEVLPSSSEAEPSAEPVHKRLRSYYAPPKVQTATVPMASMPIYDKIFASLQFYILTANFGKRRLKVFQNNITSQGGEFVKEEALADAHDVFIVVNESVDRALYNRITNILPWFKNKENIVSCEWISRCIKENRLIDYDDYILVEKPIDETNRGHDPSCSGNDQQGENNQLSEMGSSTSSSSKSKSQGKGEGFDGTDIPGKFQSKFACAHPSTSSSSSPNSYITAELKKLLEAYRAMNETWRVVAYEKAIKAIENHNQPLTSYEMARTLPGVGDKLATKVAEIIATGKLRKVEAVCEADETKVITKFLGVWGAGPSTANAWYNQGYRTIEDLKYCPTLTRHQRIGVKLYDDLNERISRKEVEEVFKYVRICAGQVQENLIVEVCGSYRRGRETCGDVDVLVTHPDGYSHTGIFYPMLDHMRRKGFLTDDLVTQELNGNQQKYLGICKLPHYPLHRRLDIIVVPYSEYAPALMYFTGSAHFNRSMRLLAAKLGMSLSEHGLRMNIVRKAMYLNQANPKLNDGVLLLTPTEKSIFDHLGLPYRSPQERDI